MKFERMKYIAEHFQEQHLERIDKCEIIESLMWENYYAEQNPINKVRTLESIIEMQPYLSAYYDAIRYVLMQSIKPNADLKEPLETYVSVDLRHFREKEIVQDKAQGKLFNPYKKDADPYLDQTVKETATNTQLPHKYFSEEEIQENMKKVRKNSNLKDFDATRKNRNNSVESASWANDDEIPPVV